MTSRVRRSWLWLLVVAAGVGVLAGPAHANLNFVVTPTDLASPLDFYNGQGGQKFSYDGWAPIGATGTSAPGFGSGSFWSDVQGSSAGNPNDRDYATFRMSPKDIFGRSTVTMADLRHLSYWTKNANPSLIDWQLKIYTMPTNAGWYGHRFNFTRPVNPDTDWYLSSTDGASLPDNTLMVDWVVGSGENYYPVNLTLADLATNYGGETVMMIDIIAGFATASPPVDSYLDGVEMGLWSSDHSTFETATMNLEPVPEPGSLLLVGTMLLGAVGLAARRRHRRVQD